MFPEKFDISSQRDPIFIGKTIHVLISYFRSRDGKGEQISCLFTESFHILSVTSHPLFSDHFGDQHSSCKQLQKTRRLRDGDKPGISQELKANRSGHSIDFSEFQAPTSPILRLKFAWIVDMPANILLHFYRVAFYFSMIGRKEGGGGIFTCQTRISAITWRLKYQIT